MPKALGNCNIQKRFFVLSVVLNLAFLSFYCFYVRNLHKLYVDIGEARSIPKTVLWKGRGSTAYRVIFDYVVAERLERYAVTYTTHATPEYLSHVSTVSERWQGPISVAIYAPGDDYHWTAAMIERLRSCGPRSVADFVSFHVFFDEVNNDGNNNNNNVASVVSSFPTASNCSAPIATPETSYRKRYNMSYPVNVARNVARSAARTRYVLASDLELYPSAGLIEKFTQMISRNFSSNSSSSAVAPRLRQVFVLPVFELFEGVALPETKHQLVELYKKGKAITFHKFVCLECHLIPGIKDWIARVPPDDQPLGVFAVVHPHPQWEPIFIGTHEDPFYDERLSWEGMSDKQTQMYEMCLRNYELHILDSAFLVHAPGIKRPNATKDAWRNRWKTRQYPIKQQVIRDINARFPQRKNCSML